MMNHTSTPPTPASQAIACEGIVGRMTMRTREAPNHCHEPLLMGWKGVLCERYAGCSVADDSKGAMAAICPGWWHDPLPLCFVGGWGYSFFFS